MAAKAKTELEHWQNAVRDSQSTIKFLEARGDEKNKRIRELQQQIRELGGTP